MARYTRLSASEPLQSCVTVRQAWQCSGQSQRTPSVELAEMAAPDEQSAMQLTTLPPGLMEEVLDFLPPDSLLDAACVCRSWHHAVHMDKNKRISVAWYCKAFLQPGLVATFRTKPRILSYASQRRLLDLRESIGKMMMLQL